MELGGCCLQLLWLRVLIRRWFNVTILDDFSSDELSADEEEEEEEEDDVEKEEEEEDAAHSDPESEQPFSDEPLGIWPPNTTRSNQQALLERDFLNTEQLSIAVGTWNVAGRTPPPHLDLMDWLEVNGPADIYVVGFQEIVPLNVGNVCGVEDVEPAIRWQALIRDTLNRLESAEVEDDWNSIKENIPISMENCNDQTMEDETLLRPLLSSIPSVPSTFSEPSKRQVHYVRVASKQMVGIHISIWVRRKLCRYIHRLSVSCVGLGLMGCLGNKGSICVSMRLHQTSFCFICAHLTSGNKEGDEQRRNWDAMEVLKRTHFPLDKDATTDGLRNIWGHDRIIWLGDLNYRLNLMDNEIRLLVAKEDWTGLFKKDQLKKQSEKGHIFEGWHEGTITFAPTYKYKFDSNLYAGETVKLGEKQRSPAWSSIAVTRVASFELSTIFCGHDMSCVWVSVDVRLYWVFSLNKEGKFTNLLNFRCDRVLWHGKGLKLLTYKRGESMLSDHRPVIAVFSAEVELLMQSKAHKLINGQACTYGS